MQNLLYLFFSIIENDNNYIEEFNIYYKRKNYDDKFITSFLFQEMKDIRFICNNINYNEFIKNIITFRKYLITIDLFFL
jgi:hypothetical protein